MKKVFYAILLLIIIVSCKDEKAKNVGNESLIKEDAVSTTPSSFENELLDLREIKLQFTPEYKLKKFGLQKINDTVFNFVFQLDQSTKAETVEKYSIGVKGFDEKLEKPFRSSYNPILKTIEANNYIFLKSGLDDIRYFDSLDVYIYKRKDWKGSGRLAGVKIRDIYFKEK